MQRLPLVFPPPSPTPPPGATLSFLRRLDDRNQRFDALHDVLDLVALHPREPLAQLRAQIVAMWRGQFVGDLARHREDEVLAMLAWARWYRGLRKTQRRLAYGAISSAIVALPRLGLTPAEARALEGA